MLERQQLEIGGGLRHGRGGTVLTTLHAFSRGVRARIRDKHCTAGVCRGLRAPAGAGARCDRSRRGGTPWFNRTPQARQWVSPRVGVDSHEHACGV